MASKFQRPTADDFGFGQDTQRGLIFVGAMALVMWISEIIDALPNVDLDQYGIRPRELQGLEGIAFSPFLHGGWDHLIGNTIPFVILGATIAMSGLARIAWVTLIVVVIGGFFTWLFSPDHSVIIGASGVVFGYAAYLVARWLYTRQLIHLLTGLIVAVVWGATLMAGLVPTPGVSWQAHLFGALGGFAAARLLDGRDRAREVKARGESPSAFTGR